MLKKTVILTLILILGVVVIAQDSPPAISSAPKSAGGEKPKSFSWGSIKNLSFATSFVSFDGRFKIGLSQQIQGFAGLSPKEVGVKASGSQFTWKFDEGEIVIAFLDFPKTDLLGTNEDIQRITQNTKKNILSRSPNAKIRDESFFNLSIFPASKMSFDFPDKSVTVQRIYLVNNRMYRILAGFQNAENEKFVNVALDTFKFISQAEIETELQKKYESMKPAPLPQTPVVPKLKSDAEDENLKGKVKKVVEESEDLSGTWSVQGRKMSSVIYFNEQGNFVQQDLYDYKGLPDRIMVYGYISGKKVSREKTTNYDDNPPIMAPAPIGKKAETLPKPDTRYNFSYDYKYLNGKLVEKIWRFNTGKLWLRNVFKHSTNQSEELVYSDDGKLNQHYSIKLDENGNELEKTDKDVFGMYGERKYRYEYEFDNQGNWIKQITYKEEPKNGVKQFKPYSVDYRTITYW